MLIMAITISQAKEELRGMEECLGFKISLDNIDMIEEALQVAKRLNRNGYISDHKKGESPNDYIRRVYREGGNSKMDAIQACRYKLGYGLKDSKEYVEQIT